jgi:hypothetical protein
VDRTGAPHETSRSRVGIARSALNVTHMCGDWLQPSGAGDRASKEREASAERSTGREVGVSLAAPVRRPINARRQHSASRTPRISTCAQSLRKPNSAAGQTPLRPSTSGRGAPLLFSQRALRRALGASVVAARPDPRLRVVCQISESAAPYGFLRDRAQVVVAAARWSLDADLG